MSDTPKTDAVNARDHDAVTGYYAMTEHARHLERHLAKANSQAEDFERKWYLATDRIADLEQQLEQRPKDAERYRMAVLYLMTEGIDECWQEKYCPVENWSAREGGTDVQDNEIINAVFESMKLYWWPHAAIAADPSKP